MTKCMKIFGVIMMVIILFMTHGCATMMTEMQWKPVVHQERKHSYEVVNTECKFFYRDNIIDIVEKELCKEYNVKVETYKRHDANGLLMTVLSPVGVAEFILLPIFIADIIQANKINNKYKNKNPKTLEEIETGRLVACGTKEASYKEVELYVPEYKLRIIIETDSYGSIALPDDLILSSSRPFSIRTKLVKNPTNSFEKLLTDSELKNLKDSCLETSPVGVPSNPPHPIAKISYSNKKDSDTNYLDLEVEVMNKGDGDLYRLWGHIYAEPPLKIGRKDLFFGHIKPGEKVKLKRKIQYQNNAKFSRKVVKIKFSEHNDFIPDEINTYVVVK